jgi:eukaryotic-like serine/threonine-protein kinase
MDSPSRSSKVLRFGVFELDPDTQQLRRAGVLLRIQPQPFKVLALLASRPKELVSREELRHELWGDETFVDFERGLNYCIRQIRAVLGDEAQIPRYIETLPRRGYRFIFPLEADTAQKAKPNVAPGKPPFLQRSWTLVAAAALLALLIGATVYVVSFHSSPRLSQRDTVVLADFLNTTGDPAFDDVLRQALAIQLEQSPFLNILSNDRVTNTLKRMDRPGERLTLEVAREVCQRTNSKVMLAGSIASVGSHYLVGLRGTDCQTGDTLTSAQAEADNRDKVLNALEKASNQLRRKLGESLASVNRFNKPLDEATTSSLEALKAYTQGAAMTDRPEGIPYLQRAVRLDPNFARAYAALATVYANSNQLILAHENFKKAYELRERVSDRERIYIETTFYMVVTGELEKANQSYLRLISEYPDSPGSYGNLGFNYLIMGSYEKAVELTREALRRDPDFPIWNGNLAWNYLALDRLDEAKAVFDQALAHKVDGIDLRLSRYYLAFLQNDDAKMREQVAWATGKPELEDWLFSAESDTAAYYGRFNQARDLSEHATASAKSSGATETAAAWQANAALRSAELGSYAEARQTATRALALSPGQGVRILTALALARSGDWQRAQNLADSLQREFPMNTMILAYWLPTIRASVELDRGNPARAIELLQATSPYELAQTWQFQFGTMYPVYIRGVAYLRRAQGGRAAAEFQKILDHRSLVVNFPLESLAHLQLARAEAMRKNNDASRKAYQDFFALWKDADPDIPILKQAKLEYAKLR